MTLAWGLLFKLMPDHDQGATSSLAIVTRGIGLLAGPPIVGLVIDLSASALEATDWVRGHVGGGGPTRAARHATPQAPR